MSSPLTDDVAEKYVSVAATARAAGVSEQLVRDNAEQLGARRFGRRTLIPKDALDRLPLVKKTEV